MHGRGCGASQSLVPIHGSSLITALSVAEPAAEMLRRASSCLDDVNELVCGGRCIAFACHLAVIAV